MNLSAATTVANGLSIVSYLWEKIDNEKVSIIINNDEQLNASFTAPYVSTSTNLIFKLTVTDSEGLSASDTATITINPAPASRDIALHPFSSTSPWNMPVGSDAVFEADGDPLISSLLGLSLLEKDRPKAVINRDNWSISVFLATNSDPTVTIQGIRNKTSFTGNVPLVAGPTEGEDRHVTIIQPDRRKAYDIFKWESYVDSLVTGQIARQIDLAGSGIRSGTRAAAVPSIAGLIRDEELRKGTISHALALAVPGVVLKSGPVWPATQQDSDHATSYIGDVPMGTLFAIPGSVNITSLGITSTEGLALAHALQNYGAYLVDRAGHNVLYCELTCNDAGYESLRTSWRILMPHLRAVTNNTEQTPGGGGTPRVPLLPEAQ